MATTSPRPAVTVVIPTLDGERYLAQVLDAVAAQEGAGAVEVLVIDSGSTDGTLEIVRTRPAVRLHEIPNSEFGHGRTRNLGASMAKGSVVAFLTQDAIPIGTGWLAELIAPLADPAVGGVTGRQVPRTGCFPLLKYEIIATFRSIGPDQGVTLTARASAEPEGTELDRLGFYSDVNAAARRDFLVGEMPYRDLPYSEDMAFGRDIILAGYRKAYAAEGAVTHSNDLTLEEYGKRIFDETLALRRIGADMRAVGPFGALLRIIKGALSDSVRIARDAEYRTSTRLFWLLRNPRYHGVKWTNYRRAMRVALDDSAAIARHSLESERTAAHRSSEQE